MLDSHPLGLLDRLIWSLVGVIAMIVLMAATLGNFHIVWATFAVPAASIALLLAGAWYYERWRDDHKIATALGGSAQMVAFTMVGAPLSYIAASANLPLQDHLFTNIDHALGLDWKGLLALMNSASAIHFVFKAAYLSFMAQVITTVLVLAFAGRLIQLRIFMLAVVMSAVICIAISAVMPAEGVWGYFRLTPNDYPDIIPATREFHLFTYIGLRDGSFRYLTGMDSQGIITFPSFHAVLAVIFAVTMWSVPVLRWIGVVVNTTMIAATPIDGGHYFIDIFAGIGIAVLCLGAAHTIASRIAAGRPRFAQPVTSEPLRAAE